MNGITPRPTPKKRAVRDTTVGYRPSEIVTGFEGARQAGGGIVPGAHPEGELVRPIAGPKEIWAQIKGLFRGGKK